ncbi:Rieske [2Fe-2S] iron-sulfur domain-containing protein [Aspergillus unguis]
MTFAYALFLALFAAAAYLYRVYISATIILTPQPPQQKTEYTVTKEPDLPTAWLTSHSIFELEKRALFSKTPLPLTLTPRLPSPGSYITLHPASLPVLVLRAKDASLRAFHNVCRHRAYPVVPPGRESGQSLVLRCRLGGVEGFEKKGNGLFGVRVWVERGVVWGWMGGDGDDEGEGGEGGEGGDVDMERMIWTGGKSLEGIFNWKTALRIQLLSDALGLCNPQEASVWENILGCFRQTRSAVFLFPSMFLFPVPGSRWLSLSIFPASERRTTLRYDLYCPDSNDNQLAQALLVGFEGKMTRLVSLLEREYQDCTGNIPALDPESLETQTRILALLKSHSAAEKAIEREIYPVRRKAREGHGNARSLAAEKRMSLFQFV